MPTPIQSPARQRVLFLLFILYLTFIGGSAYTEANLVPYILHQTIITVVFGLWLFRLWRSGRGLPATPLDGPLLAYGVVLLVSSLVGWYPRVSLAQTWTQLVHVLLFYLLVDMVRLGRQRWIIDALFLGAAVAVMLSALEFVSWYFGVSTFIGSFTQGWPQIGAGLFPPYVYRVSLAMTNANLLASYTALLIPVVLVWAVTTRHRDLRRGAWLLLGGLAMVIGLAQSRGGWMSVGVALAVMAGFALWHRRHHLPRLRPALWAGLLLVGLVVLAAVGYVSVQFFLVRSAGDAGRLDMWRSALEIARDHPVLGVGPYMYGSALRVYRDPELVPLLDKLVAAHNLYLQVLAELGLAGLAVLTWLVIAGGWAWWQHWRATDSRHRIRLEACLAVFIGFGVQSMVDVFTVTPVILPLLAYGAYIIGGRRFAGLDQAAGRRRWAVALVGILVVGYAAAFVPVDLGMLHLMQSTNHLHNENLEAALQSAEMAIATDPALDLYRAQRAYVLGLLAAETPEMYLDRAVAAHKAVLAVRPTFDLGYANLAALYHQHGEPAEALAALEAALAINPADAAYFIAAGVQYEALGDEDGAHKAYARALRLNPTLAGSGFWEGREGMLAAARAQLHEWDASFEALAAALAANDMVAAAEIVETVGEVPGWYWPSAVGRYYLRQGDPVAAARVLETALALAPPAQRWRPYMHLAEVYASQGDRAASEQAALTALFIDASYAARANYTLARQALEVGDIVRAEALLAEAVPGRVVFQYFTVASYGPVFSRLVSFDYLPQLNAPGLGEAAYAPWLDLAALYESMGRLERAAYVYRVIAESDPYLSEEMNARRAALNFE